MPHNNPRRSVHVEGLSHGGQPIPNASRIDNMVWSGGVSGLDPSAGTLPADIAGEVAQMFENVANIIGAAGGSLDDIIRISVTVRDRAESRDTINQYWVKYFPDAENRPARHLVEQPLVGGMRVQCEFVAVVGE